MVARTTEWAFLGRVPYAEGLALQQVTAAGLKRGDGPERLLLLEHPPVFTLGRNASEADIVAPREWLEAQGIEVHETNRGGEVTYHGPGQLVGYPILNLNPDRRDIRRYVRDLQEVLIRTLADFGVTAFRHEAPGHIGVWVREGKIASIGVHLSRWVTTHGFALNVTTDLGHFGGIVPCGLVGVRMVALSELVAEAPSLEAVAARVVHHFGPVFDRQVVPPGGSA
ncbi:MAG: lipoyl(octanoyl) transferase LipB [Thermoanaerobaculia bacterium]|nr:lipoyl(octanoyl) transferase LipB [Thermoanaerobaculia bacterium]